MPERLELQVRNDLAELERVGRLLRDFGARHALPERSTFELTLALDELLTNVISYAYADTGAHEILVHIALDGAEVHVRIEDDGQPFDPLGLPPPDIDLSVEERPIGGLGVHLVRRVTDAITYRRESDRNVLTLTKRVT